MIFLSVCLTILSPQIPTFIVRALGIGAYENADLVIDRPCCGALAAEGMPLVGNPASWNEELLKDKYDKESLSYILAINGDTVILKHIHVLLRIGSQVALRDRRQPEKQQEFGNRRIILLPSQAEGISRLKWQVRLTGGMPGTRQPFPVALYP